MQRSVHHYPSPYRGGEQDDADNGILNFDAHSLSRFLIIKNKIVSEKDFQAFIHKNM